MGTFERIQDVVSTVGQTVQKTVDIKLLRIKINGCEKELRTCYVLLGQAFYQSKTKRTPPDEKTVSAVVANIDHLIYRIRLLTTQLDTIRQSGSPDQRKSVPSQTNDKEETTPEEHYLKLNRKKDDLKIRRTGQGIKAVRVCPVCAVPNDPDDRFCAACGAALRIRPDGENEVSDSGVEQR